MPTPSPNDQPLRRLSQDDQHIQELVHQAQAGNQQSAGELFDLLVDRIFRFFSSRLGDRNQAEDLTQTVFLEMLQSLPRYHDQPNTKFTTWLFQIARFRLIDAYRRQHHDVALDDVPEPAADESFRDPVIHDRLQTAMKSLPERYSTVLELRFRQDLTAKETAAIMNTSVINVRVLQHRALRQLHKLMKRDDDRVADERYAHSFTH